MNKEKGTKRKTNQQDTYTILYTNNVNIYERQQNKTK